MSSVVKHDQAPVQNLGGGVVRRILSHTKDMMVVEITFPAGGVGAAHTHPHLQSSYVKSGEFEYTVGEEKVLVKERESVSIPTKLLRRPTLARVFIWSSMPSR